MDTPPLFPRVDLSDCRTDGHKQAADIASCVPRVPGERSSVDVDDANQLRSGIEFLLRRRNSGRGVHPEVVDRVIRDANEQCNRAQGKESMLAIVRAIINNIPAISDTKCFSSVLELPIDQADAALRRLDHPMLKAIVAYYLDRITDERAIAEKAGVPLDRFRKTRNTLLKAVGAFRLGTDEAETTSDNDRPSASYGIKRPRFFQSH